MWVALLSLAEMIFSFGALPFRRQMLLNRRPLELGMGQPIAAIDHPAADGKEQIGIGHIFVSLEICAGARQGENAIVGAGREPKSPHRLLQRALAGAAEATMGADLPRTHLRVAAHFTGG